MRCFKIFSFAALSFLLLPKLGYARDFERGSESGYEVHEQGKDGSRQKIYRQGRYKAEGQREVGQIADSEVEQLRKRRHSLNLWGLGLGPYRVGKLGSQALLYGLAATHHREVTERGEVRIRFGGGMAEDGSAYTASTMLGGAFMPLTGDITPLIGAEFGLAYADGKEIKKAAAGFAAAGVVGLRFFRTSSTQLEIAARYETVLKENEKGRPSTYGAQLAILF